MSEHDEQVALFQWAALAAAQYPCLQLMYAIPNGGHRIPAVAARLKDEGVKAGVPDICLPVPSRQYHGLYIELKFGKNKPTHEQLEWVCLLRDQGYFVTVAYGWEAASQRIRNYLEGRV